MVWKGVDQSLEIRGAVCRRYQSHSIAGHHYEIIDAIEHDWPSFGVHDVSFRIE